MIRFSRLAEICCVLLLLAVHPGSTARTAWAQPSPKSQPTEADELALDQSKLADRYERVEKLILRMAEFDQADNPRRSELLKNAFALAKDRDIQLQMDAASRMLEQQKLQRAIDEQEQVRRDMQALLELLLTENRADRLKDEQARVRDYIREIERLERMQRSVQARTEGGVESELLQREQNQVADAAQQLHEKIEQTELAANPLDSGDERQGTGENDQPSSLDDAAGKESTPGSGETGDEREPANGQDQGSANEDEAQDDPRGESRANPLRPQTDKLPSGSQNKFRTPQEEADQTSPAGDPSEGRPPTSAKDDSASPADGEPSDAGSAEKSPSNPSEESPSSPSSPETPAPGGPPPQGGGDAVGDAGDGDAGDGGSSSAAPQQPEVPDFPGLKRVQEAEQKMRDAEQKLAKAKREGAIEDQREAAKKLAEAKAELEKVLRQMREEEIERVLAALEVRFRKMLEMQLRVYEDTLRVARIPTEDRDRFVEIEAGKLSFQERRIVVEADKCLAVLREEGSSVAFPESTQQMRDDMQQVTDLLAAANVARLTQGIEEDIIESLEEMIAALEQAQTDQEQRNQDAPSMPSTMPGDLPLVDALAELKMLKALQIRINRRTSRYAAMLDDTDDPVGKPTDDKLLGAVQELSARQRRLQEITRDISIGKNN